LIEGESDGEHRYLRAAEDDECGVLRFRRELGLASSAKVFADGCKRCVAQ